VLIACLFAMAYAANPAIVKQFHDHLVTCAQELNKQQNDVNVALCAHQKQGLIDKKGMYSIDKGLAIINDLISDEAKQNQAREVIHKCYDEVGYGTPEGNLEEKTLKLMQCGMVLLPLIDEA